MLLGLGLFTPMALAGSVFYIAHHIVVKTNLFLVSGVVHALRGTSSLPQLGGLYPRHGALAVLFLVPALSLAGVPPLSGFWAKLMLLNAGLDAGQHLAVGVALVVSFWTLFSMTKIWAEAFWKAGDPHDERVLDAGTWRRLAGPVAALALITIAIGLVADPLVRLSVRASGELFDTDAYVRAVMREVR
jgi:multicomponent Na+:H+ antiporter subunit D